MKSFIFQLVGFVLLLALLFSCSIDNVKNEEIIGFWKFETVELDKDYDEYLSFDSNQVVYKFKIIKESNTEVLGAKGNYNVNERNLQIVFDGQGELFDYIIARDTLLISNNFTNAVLTRSSNLDLAYIPNL